jgi:hypothetical protein
MSAAVDFQIILVMLLTAGLLVAFMREWALPDVIAQIPENDLGKCRTVRVFEIIRDGLSVSDAPLNLALFAAATIFIPHFWPFWPK